MRKEHIYDILRKIYIQESLYTNIKFSRHTPFFADTDEFIILELTKILGIRRTNITSGNIT